MHTCHFHLHVAGCVGPLPHISFYSLPGGACTSLVGSSVTLQGVSLPPLLHYSLLGCVAATLIALLFITRVCCCHPPPPHFMLGCTQQPVVPFTAKYCVLFGCYGVCDTILFNNKEICIDGKRFSRRNGLPKALKELKIL